MAEVDVVMAPAADAQQKRSFADNITNKNTTTSSRKKSKPDPKELVLFEWSVEDMASKEAPSDATILSPACRRPYGVTAIVQLRHAPKSLSPNAAFYEHASPSAADAVKARRSGVTLGAKQPLKKRPLFGGMADVSKAPAAPANIVGVDEKNAVASKKGTDRRARQKQARGTGKGQKKKGVTCGPPFQLWLSIKEGQDAASPWYTDNVKAAADCKRRWPVETAKGYPDYATTKITGGLILMLQGVHPSKIPGCNVENMKRDRDATNWKLAWKKPGA